MDDLCEVTAQYIISGLEKRQPYKKIKDFALEK